MFPCQNANVNGISFVVEMDTVFTEIGDVIGFGIVLIAVMKNLVFPHQLSPQVTAVTKIKELKIFQVLQTF